MGGLGLAPSANIGNDHAIFEAVHGTAPDIAGKNLANPTALILSASMMLEHLGYRAESDRLNDAIRDILRNKEKCTVDLGGHATTTEFTDYIIEKI